MFMKIYIPTLDRVDNQITFDNLPDKHKEQVVFVVQEHERPKHKRDVEYMVVGDNIGLSETRRQIFYAVGKNRFTLYDDDLVFYRRNIKYTTGSSDMEGSKRKMTESDFDEMYDTLNGWLDNGYIQCGHRETLLPPLGKLHQDNLGMFSGFTMNGELISKFIDDVDWTYTYVGQDSMWQIEFLTRGHKIRMSDIFTQKSEWWQDGGCSKYRDATMYNEEHRKLVEKYPEFVKESGSVTRKNIGEIIKLRYRWRDAYKYGQSSNLNKYFGE